MRNSLLGGTALLLVTGLAGGASAADKIGLGLEGYYAIFGVVADQDDGTGEAGDGLREHGLARESEVGFIGETTLDNGITVGVDVQLQGETVGDQIDESYIFFEGAFGRIQLGSEDPAPDEMIYGAPTPIAENGVNSPTFFHAAAGANAVGSGTTYVNLTSDSDKITYFTPRFHGFQLGASYTPDNTEELAFALRPDVIPAGATPQQSEVFEGAVNWVGSVGGADIGVYGGYSKGEVEGPAPGFEDQDMWGAGGSVGYRGFTLGASYRWTDQGLAGSNTDRWDANVGLTYGWGQWLVGIAYAHAEAEVGPGAGEDDMDHVEVGFTYSLGPGVDLAGGVQFVDFDSDTGGPAAENDAVIGLLGTVLTF